MAKQPPDANKPRTGKMTTQINRGGAPSRQTMSMKSPPTGGAGGRKTQAMTGNKSVRQTKTSSRPAASGKIDVSATAGTGTSLNLKGSGSDGGGRQRGGQSRDYKIRMSGMPLSLRFMLWISSSTGGLMFVFFVIVYLISTNTLYDAVRNDGANQARSAGKLCKVYVETVTNPQFLDALLKDPAIQEGLRPFFAGLRTQYSLESYTPSGNPIMRDFRLNNAQPVYEDRSQFQADMVRAVCHHYPVFIEPERHAEQVGLRLSPGANLSGVKFDWNPASNRPLVDAFLAFLAEGFRDNLFPNPADAGQFAVLKKTLHTAIEQSPDVLKNRLQQAYQKAFQERYIDTMAATGHVIGVKFGRVNQASQRGVDEFETAPGFNASASGSDMFEDVRIKRDIGPNSTPGQFFFYNFQAEVTDAAGRIETRDYQVVVVFDESKVQASMNRLVTILVAIALLVVVVGICVSYFLASKVTKPINSLVEDVIVIARGDYKHRTRMKTNDEIGVLAKTIDMMTEGLEEAKVIALERGQLQHDINIAEEVVIHLLPDTLPKIYGYDIYAFYSPSKDVGGDYYDFYEIDPNHVGMIVADVSGKGIPGAMVMTMARSVLRYESMATSSPRETFMRANRHIARDIKRGMFVTALYLVLNTQTAEMTVASAGHNPLLLWRASTGQIEEVNPNGIALGFDKGPIFERTIKEQKVQLYSGDRVIIYTDGVPEAMSPEGEEYGEEAFNALIMGHPDANSNQLTNLVVDALRDHQGEEQHDDITIVTFKLL